MVRTLLSACLFALLALPVHGETAQELLARSDVIRNPARPFGLTLDLVEYRDGRQANVSELDVYARAEPDSGRFRTLVRFVAPARDAGKLMLKTGNDLWFFDPASKVTMRIAPQQRLLGQAANGDVVTVNLAQDYTAVLKGEEDVSDGDRQTRRAWRLELQAASADVTYHAITLWLARDNARPLKALFYAESGRLLKTVYYRRYQDQLGEKRPTEMVIIDGLNAAWITIMRYRDYAWRDVPEQWLQRDYLPRFRPE